MTKLKINAFFYGAGHHKASWRLPGAKPQDMYDFAAVRKIAATAERGLLDSLFLADGYIGLGTKLEPLTLLSALASTTSRIGLIATVVTAYNEPYHVARKFASLDHISRGRAAWNIVTGADSAAANFGREEHPEHRERYDAADEFVDIVKRLWDSCEDGARIYDKAAGIALRPDKVHEIDYQGKTYAVKGPLSLARPPQGHPVLVQAGSSERGMTFAARTAEVVFTAQATLGDAQAFYKDLKSRVIRCGRQPDQVKIMPGISTIVADTVAEARDREEELFSLVNQRETLQALSGQFGTDLSSYPLDEPLTLAGAIEADQVNAMKSRHQLALDLVRRDKLTLRQLMKHLAGGRGHLVFTGTPVQLADVMENWFRNGAADGFNLMPQVFPEGLESFVDKVVPELQNRGLFRTAYEGATLRENLGLARPENAGFPSVPAGREPIP